MAFDREIGSWVDDVFRHAQAVERPRMGVVLVELLGEGGGRRVEGDGEQVLLAISGSAERFRASLAKHPTSFGELIWDAGLTIRGDAQYSMAVFSRLVATPGEERPPQGA